MLLEFWILVPLIYIAFKFQRQFCPLKPAKSHLIKQKSIKVATVEKNSHSKIAWDSLTRNYFI